VPLRKSVIVSKYRKYRYEKKTARNNGHETTVVGKRQKMTMFALTVRQYADPIRGKDQQRARQHAETGYRQTRRDNIADGNNGAVYRRNRTGCRKELACVHSLESNKRIFFRKPLTASPVLYGCVKVL